jgi:hypothetical protein
MMDLSNPRSEIYKNTLEKQILYISRRLTNLKNRHLGDEMGCCGAKETIAKHLNQGPAQNTVQSFFTFKATKCIVCEGKIRENGITQLERAHCNIYSRYDLLLMAITDLWVDNKTPIGAGAILKLFIQKHDVCPIYMLCKKCHVKYDNQ